MKKVRIVIVILFIEALGVFLFLRWRERKNSDYTPPVISAETDKLEASVNVTDEELLRGMSAVDNRDGDVSSTLVVASRTKFIRKDTVKVNYAAFDRDSNVGSYVRELTYTDYVPPRFSISGPLCFIESNSRDNAQILRNITATDCIDGDITSQIMVNLGEIRTIGEGVSAQMVNLQVSNRSGDTSILDVLVRFEEYNIFNQQKPHLSEYLVYTRAGEPAPDFLSYTDGVGYGNNITSFADTGFVRTQDVWVDTSLLDLETPGVYEVVYTLSRTQEDGSRTELGSSYMTVVVTEE